MRSLETGHPQNGHAVALSEISFLHSAHGIKAISKLPFYSTSLEKIPYPEVKNAKKLVSRYRHISVSFLAQRSKYIASLHQHEIISQIVSELRAVVGLFLFY
jgi:hypothetical protein